MEPSTLTVEIPFSSVPAGLLYIRSIIVDRSVGALNLSMLYNFVLCNAF